MECILHLVDPSFDQGHTEKYRLSILLRPDGFSFSVLDPRITTFVALEDYRLHPAGSSSRKGPDASCSAIRKEFENNLLLGKSFGKCDVMYASPKVTLVPPGFITDKNKEEYFRFNHVLDAIELIESEIVPVGEMTAVFALPACTSRLRDDLFPGSRIGCSATVLIQGLLKANAHILARQVFVNSWDSFFDIIVVQGRRLLYFNTFRKKAPEDIAYFVLFVLEQLGFIPAEEEITFMGDITSESDDYKLLSQYIDKISFANLFPFADFSPVFSEVLVHKYYTLFNLPFCE